MTRRILFGITAAFALTFAARGAQAETFVARLTEDVVPLAYDLTIAPNVEQSASAGSESIDVRVRVPVDAVALNAKGIEVTRALVDGRVASVTTLPAIEQIWLRTGSRLAAGPHRVDLTFTSVINTGADPHGLFYDFGDPHVSTIFEPSTARTMFPCFDEPQFRARFTLHVRAPAEWTVVSNMPLHARHDVGASAVQSDFDSTPPMPAYLLTLDAGVYAHADGIAGTVPIRVFVRPGQEGHARVMLAQAERLLPFYERFFGVPFPLPKLDIVVSPGSLQSALEGWGAITFYSEGNAFGGGFAGERGERYAVEMLAHEMAHQWVGDLVTMRWWRDTFVAEAVATYAQRQAVRAVFPELRSWRDDDHGLGDVMSAGVRRGSRPSVHEIRTDLQADADTAFSPATYEKGASVIEGWQEAIGDRRFHASLQLYLTRYAYGSATFEDFWSTLGGAAGVAYGRSWLTQRGYPIVDVRAVCASGHETVIVSQTPFVTDPDVEPVYRMQRWLVPVTLRSGSGTRRLVLGAARQVERMQSCASVTIDPGMRPYYLVRYDAPRYHELAAGVAAMDERTRALVYRDATSLHAAGALPDADYVRLLAAAAEPMDFDVWDVLAREYARLDDLIRGAPEANVLYAMEMRSLFPIVDRYGRIAAQTAPFRAGRDSASALAEVGDPAIGSGFKADFFAMVAGTASVNNREAEWLTPALAAADATAADVDRVEASMRALTPATRVVAIPPPLSYEFTFLTSIRDDALANRVLADAMHDRALTQDAPLGFLFALGKRHPELAYGYLRTHLTALKKPLAPTQQAWTIANGVATSLWRGAPPDELKRFLEAAFPADRAIVLNAFRTIDRHWHDRRALRAALREIRATPN